MMKQLLLAFALSISFDLSADSGWSSPATVFSSTGTTPYIATDSQGNGIAIWYDQTGDGTLQAATWTSGQPNWTLTDPISTPVLFPTSANSQGVPLAVASDGTAYVTWTDGNNNVLVATLPQGAQTWSSPTTINTTSAVEIGSPTLSVAQNGNVVVIWSNGTQLFNNSYNSSSQTWQGQPFLPLTIPSGSLLNQVVVDGVGNALVILSQMPQNLYAYTFQFDSNSWGEISFLPVGQNVCSSIAVDPMGDGLAIAITSDGAVTAALCPFQSPAFVNPQILSTTGDGASSLPCLEMDQEGNGVAAWVENSGNIATARYNSTSGNWISLPPISFTGANPSNLRLSIDAESNALLTWTLSTQQIAAAVLAANHGVWQLVTVVSQALTNERNSDVVITTNGDALAIWEDDAASNSVGNIVTSLFPGLFASPTALAPMNFSGVAISNRGLTHTTTFNRLSWTANAYPVITHYILLRNGTVIASLDSGSESYIVDDPITGSNQYTLFSLTATNIVSTSLTLTLP